MKTKLLRISKKICKYINKNCYVIDWDDQFIMCRVLRDKKWVTIIRNNDDGSEEMDWKVVKGFHIKEPIEVNTEDSVVYYIKNERYEALSTINDLLFNHFRSKHIQNQNRRKWYALNNKANI